MTISSDSVVVASKQQVSCDLEGDTVILHFGKGVYFGLNDVGTLVWSMLQSPMKVSHIQEAVMREYEVSVEICQRDVLSLLTELQAQGLVEICERAG